MLWVILLFTVTGILCLFVILWLRMICFSKSFREQLVKGQLETARHTLKALEGVKDNQSAIRLINQARTHLLLARCYAGGDMDNQLIQIDSQNFSERKKMY